MPKTSQAARKLSSCPSDSIPQPSAKRTVMRLPLVASSPSPFGASISVLDPAASRYTNQAATSNMDTSTC